MDLEERLVRLPRTGDFGWLRNYRDPVVPVLQAIRRRGPAARSASGNSGPFGVTVDLGSELTWYPFARRGKESRVWPAVL